MTSQMSFKPALAVGLATSLVAGIAVAAAPEAARAPASSGAVLDLSTGSGGGSGKVSLQDFSFSLSQSKRAGAAASSSACPSSTDSSRWKAPELHSNSERSSSSSSSPPAGPACVAVVVARDAGSGMATGRRKGWDGCVKGSHFASVSLTDSSRSYQLSDVTVAECTADGMVLSFTKLASSLVPKASITVSGSD